MGLVSLGLSLSRRAHERSQTTCYYGLDFYEWNMTGNFRNPSEEFD